MKISVVIPAYNEEKYIKTCLESILNQEEQADEIIVVNNNSTDKTVELAKEYPVRVVNEAEQGMIQARNRGFNEAQYEIIVRTDADTIVPQNWIKRIKKYFENEKLIALSGPSSFYETNNNLSEKAALQTQKSYLNFMTHAMGHGCLYGPNMALRKSAWERVKNSVCLNDRDVHEDLDLAIHLAPFGEIMVDDTLIVNASFRRFKKLKSYFEYPYRVVKSVNRHKQLVMKEKGKELMKKIAAKNFLAN
jgi:glycosyltransferase involved in cell wall biosynthesis